MLVGALVALTTLPFVAGAFAGGSVLLVEASWPAPAATPSVGAGERDGAFLGAWLLLAIGGTVVLLPFGTARYLLPVLPPLWILLVRRFWNPGHGLRRIRAAAGLVVAQGLALSLVLGTVGEEYAGRYRDLAVRIRESYPERNVWFVGGYLPWAVSNAPLQTVDLFEVRLKAPPAEPVPCASS